MEASNNIEEQVVQYGLGRFLDDLVTKFRTKEEALFVIERSLDKIPLSVLEENKMPEKLAAVYRDILFHLLEHGFRAENISDLLQECDRDMTNCTAYTFINALNNEAVDVVEVFYGLEAYLSSNTNFVNHADLFDKEDAEKLILNTTKQVGDASLLEFPVYQSIRNTSLAILMQLTDREAKEHMIKWLTVAFPIDEYEKKRTEWIDQQAMIELEDFTNTKKEKEHEDNKKIYWNDSINDLQSSIMKKEGRVFAESVRKLLFLIPQLEKQKYSDTDLIGRLETVLAILREEKGKKFLSQLENNERSLYFDITIYIRDIVQWLDARKDTKNASAVRESFNDIIDN